MARPPDFSVTEEYASVRGRCLGGASSSDESLFLTRLSGAAAAQRRRLGGASSSDEVLLLARFDRTALAAGFPAGMMRGLMG